MLGAALQALVEPARRLGVPSLPRRVLDVVVPDRVGGRRAWADGDRAAIEVHGVDRPDSGPFTAELEAALERQPGVAWARVNAPLARVIIAFASDAVPLPQLVDIVDRLEAAHPAALQRESRPEGPLDPGPTARALAELGADAVALAAAGVGAAATVATLPAEIAAIVTAVDTVPRLRGLVEQALGQPTANTAIALSNAVGQGLAQGFVGLALDAAYRVMALSEASANAAAWHRRAPAAFAEPGSAAAEPLVVERPAALAPGPIERWADSAGIVGLTAFTVAVPSTGSVRRSTGLALAALPKSARLGREGFATQLGRVLATRGGVALDPGALRRLDRVRTVVLDADVLVTGGKLLGTVVPLPGADPGEVTARLHAMFRATDATAVVHDGEWSLGPLDELPLTGRRGVRERRQLEAGHPDAVLGLATGRHLVALAAVVPEPTESLEALAAACHRSGRRLVVAGPASAVGGPLADAVLPGGDRLLGTVRTLQADGAGLLLLSRHRAALASADVGIGVDTAAGVSAWGADVLIGTDLALAALLIDACGVATTVSRRSVRLAQGATAIGGVAAATSGTAVVTPRALLAVNAAAAAALAQGAWAAYELALRPLIPPLSRVPWHAMPVELVLDRLAATRDGLSRAEEQRRRRRVLVPQSGSGGLLTAVVEELANPLTPILAAGAALSAAVGSVVDAGLVAAVTLTSALLGGAQRNGTDRALARLLAESAVTARVRRDGAEATIRADELVPGDIVLLAPGDVVPADGRVLASVHLELDESSLTGEPFPVAKTVAPVIAPTVAERASMVYEGTTVAAGRGTVVVVAVGAATEAGRSMAATRIGAAAGGVEARLAQITRVTVPITMGSAAAVVVAGIARGRSIAATAATGVSLAVAAVPEGLPFLVSAAQLAAARRLSRLGALVRNPRTIEALGRVDVLCFDKTGTLTEGRIALTAVAGTDGAPVSLAALSPPLRRVLAAGLRATPEPGHGQQLAHLTDRAVVAGAQEAGVDRTAGLAGWRRLSALPFEPSRGFHATLGGNQQAAMLSVKGAPEVVLPRCDSLRRDGQRIALAEEERRRLAERVERLAGQGYRVLAVAERPATPALTLDDGEVHGLTLLGFLALTDPVRPAAGTSITALHDAGVQIVMITGDHPSTAAAIARRLDLLNGGRVITGPELDALDDDALDAVLPSVVVVARGTPAHKVRVVQAFQRLHRTVAMTGDGANDAPAIRLADVGIALGRRGTPAARAAADLVVTDDRLETIISALVEGRAMWGSVRKALGILVGGNLGEIAFTVLGAALTGASPLAARQLLLVNLLTDLAPALAVALRPPRSESVAALLAEGPEASLGGALTHDIGTRAAVTALGAAGGWLLATATGYGAAAQTVALAALVGTQLGQTIAAGGRSRSVVASSIGSAAALALFIEVPAVSAFFGSTPLGLGGWGVAAAASVAATALPTAVPLLRPLVTQPTTPAAAAAAPVPPPAPVPVPA